MYSPASDVPFFNVFFRRRLDVHRVGRHRLERHRHGRVRWMPRGRGGRQRLVVAGVQNDRHCGWRGSVTSLVRVSFVVELAGRRRLATRPCTDWPLPTVGAERKDENQQQNDERCGNADDQDDVHADSCHRVGGRSTLLMMLLTVQAAVALARCRLVRERRRRGAQWPRCGPVSAVAAPCGWRWTRGARWWTVTDVLSRRRDIEACWNDGSARGRRRRGRGWISHDCSGGFFDTRRRRTVLVIIGTQMIHD